MSENKSDSLGGEIRIHLKSLNKEQQSEEMFFRNSTIESSSSEIYKSLLFKIDFIKVFDEIINKYDIKFEGRVLELGGGYGFLSAYIKKIFPDIAMLYSDVSKEAVTKSRQYEEFFNIKIDEKWITSGEDTPFAENSIDSIIFFASFHHTQNQNKVLLECYKILKPEGKVYLFLEPSCPYYLKPIYDFHVRRTEITEKYFTIGEYMKMFKNAGLTFKHYNYKNFRFRQSKASIIYYLFLSLIPGFLTSFFPCSKIIVGEKSTK